MGVTICSMFRDSVSYLPRYFHQVDELREHLPVKLVVAEGDSEDDTFHDLHQMVAVDDRVLKVDHRGPKFGSVDHQWRWALLAMVGNHCLEELDGPDPVIWVESDLMWTAATFLELLAHLKDYDAVAPMSMRHGLFYDTWGHRGLDGVKFDAHPPFHPDLIDDRLVEIGSAGSCIAMRAEVAQKARFQDDDCIVGLCRNMRELGYRLWLDPELSVTHP